MNTIASFRSRLLAVQHYAEKSGAWASDADWRRAVRRARSWAALEKTVTHLPAWHAVAVRRGRHE